MTRPNGALGRELLHPLPASLLPAAALAFVVAGAMLLAARVCESCGFAPPTNPLT